MIEIPKSENSGNSDFRNALEYWYRGYKPLSLNFDLEKDQKDSTQQEADSFYDDTYEEDHGAFSFWIKNCLRLLIYFLGSNDVIINEC